jgi:hypothetical protein
MRALIKTLALILVLACAGNALAGAYTSIGAPGTIGRSNGSITPGLPTGWAAGNLCVLIVFSQLTASDVITDPAGWTIVSNRGTHSKIYVRVMQGGDAAPTISFSQTNGHIGQIACFSGDVYTDMATIAHVSNNQFSAGANVPGVPNMTITQANTLVIIAGSHLKTATSNGSTYDDVSGFTEIQEDRPAGTLMDFVWNYQQQTTATSLSGVTRSMTGTTESGQVVALDVALRSLDTTPTFTSAPVATATTGGYTLNFTAAQSSTIFCEALPKGSSTPLAAAIEAGTGALATVTKSVTTSADSVSLTGIDVPTTDVHCVLKVSSTYSALTSLASQEKLPPTGRLYDKLTSVDAASFCSAVTSPSVAANDYIEIDSTVSPAGTAFTQPLLHNCQYPYDGDGSRQLACIRIYDDSAQGFMAGTGSSSCSGTRFALWYNNSAPIFAPNTATIVVDTGSAMTPLDIAGQATDADADALTCVKESGTLSTGLGLGGTGNGTLSGIPSVENESGDTSTIRCTDIAGASDTFILTVYPIDTITTHNCVSETLGTCVDALQAQFLDAGALTFQYSASVPAGNIISQNPAAASEQEEGTLVDLVVSRGKQNRQNIFRLRKAPPRSPSTY